MSVYVKIEKNRYIDSLETLFATTVLNDQPGIAVGYIGMCNSTFRDVIADIGLMTEEIAACTERAKAALSDFPGNGFLLDLADQLASRRK